MALLLCLEFQQTPLRFYFASGQIGAKYLSYLTASVAPKQVRSYSDEYLKILVDINQQQLEQVGYTNSLVNGEIIQNS